MKHGLYLICSLLIFIAGCDKFSAGEPNHPLLKKAESARLSGDYTSSAEYLRRYLKINPESSKTVLQLATLYDENLNDPLFAVYYYNEYLRMEPKSPDAANIKKWINRCELNYIEQKHPEKKQPPAPPEVKVETKTEVAHVQPEIKPEIKPEVKVETVPEVQAEEKTEVKPEIKVEVKPEIPPAPVTIIADGKKTELPPLNMNDLKTEENDRIKPDFPHHYIVKPGDSLSQISVRYYGTSKHYKYIMEQNKISRPNDLKAGQTILIPVLPRNKSKGL